MNSDLLDRLRERASSETVLGCVMIGLEDLQEAISALEAMPSTKAAADVMAERKRQIDKEGWTPEHDDRHTGGDMALAAASYAANAATWIGINPNLPEEKYAVLANPFRWPWAKKWWKPTNPRRDLIKAAALILAEIERLDRLPAPPKGEQGEK